MRIYIAALHLFKNVHLHGGRGSSGSYGLWLLFWWLLLWLLFWWLLLYLRFRLGDVLLLNCEANFFFFDSEDHGSLTRIVQGRVKYLQGFLLFFLYLGDHFLLLVGFVLLSVITRWALLLLLLRLYLWSNWFLNRRWNNFLGLYSGRFNIFYTFLGSIVAGLISFTGETVGASFRG